MLRCVVVSSLPMRGALTAAALALTSAVSAQTTLVSAAADGTPANGPSTGAAAISANGRFVVFSSAATNLVPGDTNDSLDVFVKDRQTGAITRVSVAADGTERVGHSGLDGVAISDDGAVVAFTSSAALVPEDTNTCGQVQPLVPTCTDIYVVVRATGAITRGSINPATLAQPDGASVEPALNGDGSVLAFTSQATNLTQLDTNGAVKDVYVRSLNSPVITRVSVSSGGVQGDTNSFKPAISDDGTIVGFLSDAMNLSDVQDPDACVPFGPTALCTRAFVHVLPTSTTTRLPTRTPTTPIAPPPGLNGAHVHDLAISADSRFLASAVMRSGSSPTAVGGTGVFFDRLTGQTSTVAGGRDGSALSMSGDGRFIAFGSTSFRLTPIPGGVQDRVLQVTTAVPLAGGFHPQDSSLDGGAVVFGSTTSLTGGGDGTGIFVLQRDRDNDGMSDEWEETFGLDPDSAADAPLDPDADGLTNLQEYQSSGHPNGTFKRYFAEGAQNSFFSTMIALLNPGTMTAHVQLRYLGSDGSQTSQAMAIAGGERRIGTTEVPDNFSTVIESDRPIVADRRMTWGAGIDAGTHGEAAIAAPATTWYLAEGATHGAFDLFYLLQNAGDTAATVTIEYLRPAPGAPVVKQYTVNPHSRRTIWVDAEGAELEATDVSAHITSTLPIIVERAMYFSSGGRPFTAGHSGAGITAPATDWFLAEGATGAFFDLYLLVANPGNGAANVTVNYLLSTGAPIVKQYVVDPRSRLTISVENEDDALASANVSAVVASTQPVIVERAMWWPFSQWHEGHLSAGATTTGTRWAFADGVVNLTAPPTATETYVLIANTSTAAGTATVRLLFPDLSSAERTVALPASSRTSVRLADLFPEAENKVFGVVVESDGVPIVVERALYGSRDGVVWNEGYAALATKLQ